MSMPHQSYQPCTSIQQGKPKVKQLKRFPIVPVGPSVAYIPLTKGQFALVDAADVELVGFHNWYAQWNPATRTFYAYREITGRKKQAMHSVLLNPVAGLLTDHINGVTLDNRRSNLRPVTKSQNRINSVHSSPSGHRGVHFRDNKWAASINISGRRVSLGCFPSLELAAAAYESAAAAHFGEYRRVA